MGFQLFFNLLIAGRYYQYSQFSIEHIHIFIEQVLIEFTINIFNNRLE